MIGQFEIINFPAAFILLGLFALAIGSLLNVIIYRLPMMLQDDWNKEARHPTHSTTKINLFFLAPFARNVKQRFQLNSIYLF